MDVFATLASSSSSSRQQQRLVCIDMHTTGEPTRIVISGYPSLLSSTSGGTSNGTLLSQRAEAKANHDHIRKLLILEPRGHFDMYAAVLRPDTELTRTGKAHMGVLFMTNDGYSTMCGHATIALGRFLLDTQDLTVFPRRNEISYDMVRKTALLKLHAPCGLVEVTVPIITTSPPPSSSSDLMMTIKSDPSKPVSFICVPSFATGINIPISLPPQYRWPELNGRTEITVDFSYGGAFYCIVSADQLGFVVSNDSSIDLEAINKATRSLKAAIINHHHDDPNLRYLFRHPESEDLGFLYSVIVGYPLTHLSHNENGDDDDDDDDDEDRKRKKKKKKKEEGQEEEEEQEELGICFFSDQQLDRSPTGSGVAARVALAYAKGELGVGGSRMYHSVVSRAFGGKGGFRGCAVGVVDVSGSGSESGGYGVDSGRGGEEDRQKMIRYPSVLVKVEGMAWYTGTHTFVVEDGDILGRDGFVVQKLVGDTGGGV